MSAGLFLTGYDLTDEGPGRTVNEDASLVRQDLGLFALADGAGGRGRGDVAATLALRTLENYVGSTVRSTHDRPDFDVLGIPEQAKRLSAAVHQAHRNILEIVAADEQRKGMATTVVAALFAPRTRQLHLAFVGDSRCYRMRHGRLELLTVDDTIATDVLELQPTTSDDVLARLPRNSVVRALGMAGELRVRMRTVDLLPGDRFVLCTDGLTSTVNTRTIWETMREPDTISVLASELLNHALASRSKDNISVLVIDSSEEAIDEGVDTRRYIEMPLADVVAPDVLVDQAPSSAELRGPEVLAEGLLGIDPASLSDHYDDDWTMDSEFPTAPLQHSLRGPAPNADVDFDPELIEPAPDTQNSVLPPAASPPSGVQDAFSESSSPQRESTPGSVDSPLPIDADDLELDDDTTHTG